MTRLRRARRLAGVVFGFGFRAAPLWMTATLLLNLVAAMSRGLLAVGFKMFVDALSGASGGRLVVITVWTAAFACLSWVAVLASANLINGLNSRVDLYGTSRLAMLTGSVSGIRHLEDPAFVRDIEAVEENRFLISNAPGKALDLLQITAQILLIVLLLAYVDPLLAVLPLFGAAPFLAEAWVVRVRQHTDDELAEGKRLASDIFALSATSAPAKELRLFGLTAELARRHRKIASDAAAAMVRTGIRTCAISALGWSIFALGFLGAIVLVLIRTAHGQASAGELLMTVALAQQTQSQVSQVAQALGDVFKTAKAAGSFLAIEDRAAPAQRMGRTSARPVPDVLRKGIALESVSFGYPGAEDDALSDVTVLLPAGKTVAVVGDNGAGKSTLVKLLSRMYEPGSGRITVDGYDYREFGAGQWRARTSGAFQDCTRFELPLGACVGVGDLPRMSRQDAVMDALHRAGAEDILSGLEGGLATPLGTSMPDGRDLSGGQWQKLALGRAMMRDEPLLLLLDEPTASLDPAAEHALFERYVAAARRTAKRSGAITLLVSHRFSSVRMADLIIVLGHGRVLQTGTHHELLAAGGRYARLYERQASQYR